MNQVNLTQPRTGQMVRVQDTERKTISFSLDGQAMTALQGDTIMTAILTQKTALRQNEFSHQPHAGFCLMGACQDCWIWCADGSRVRSCTTLLEPGMQLLSHPLIGGGFSHESR